MREVRLAENCMELRKAEGIPKYKLAEKLGVASATIEKIEKGMTISRLSTVIMIADYFHVSLDTLVYGTYDDLWK